MCASIVSHADIFFGFSFTCIPKLDSKTIFHGLISGPLGPNPRHSHQAPFAEPRGEHSAHPLVRGGGDSAARSVEFTVMVSPPPVSWSRPVLYRKGLYLGKNKGLPGVRVFGVRVCTWGGG